MSDKRKIGEEMLSANGLPPFGLHENDRLQLRKLLERDRKRVRRLKIATIIVWAVLPVVVAVWLAASRLTASVDLGQPGWSVVIVPVVFYVALALTVILIVRSFLLRNRERQVQMTEIQARLAGMEKALNQLAKKE